MIKTFKQFLGNESAWNMYITTLHSFLNKRPTINDGATSVRGISGNAVIAQAEHQGVLFIDEYSMVGEKDHMDIIAAQDEDYDGIPKFKVVWIGDPHQLPPVGDMQAIRPQGDYQVVLKTIYRQAAGNPLSNTLAQLVDMIEGEPPTALDAHETFIRNQDIIESYVSNEQNDKVILAYTNERVEELNASIQGRTGPLENDKLFSPTTKKLYTFVEFSESPRQITLPFGDDLMLNSKYKTLEYLIKNDTEFVTLEDEEGESHTFAAVFGHYQHKQKLEGLKKAAAKSNADIEREFRGYKAAGWAKANMEHPLARARAKAWRDFLSFNECVVCIDFPHAMTVHKSQGSTYDTVYVDSDDIHKCAYFSFTDYLKLMYVAISRASEKVITP